jgi:hypothetical protein
MLFGVRLQLRPPVVAENDRATVPLNPFRGATVIIDEAVVPALTVIETGLALIVKSGPATLYFTMAEWERELLVPVTVTVYVPTWPEQERVEFRGPPTRTLIGNRLQRRPPGEAKDTSVTFPVNPLIGAMTIDAFAVVPLRVLTLAGVAVTV